MSNHSKDSLCEKTKPQEKGKKVSMVGRYFQQVSHLSLFDLVALIDSDICLFMDLEPIYYGDFRIEIEESGEEKTLTVVIEHLKEDVINRDFIEKNIDWGSDGILKKEFLEKSCKKIFSLFAHNALVRITKILNDYNFKVYQMSERKMILVSEHFSFRVRFNRQYIQNLIRPIPLSMLERIDKKGRISSMVLPEVKKEGGAYEK